MTKYIYLHGFASSPQSNKARYLRDRFGELDIDLNVLDLNQGDFSHLTLTRQIQQTVAAFPEGETDITLIGSSFGGLTAAWVAEKYPQVKHLILLAPAFGFPGNWMKRLGEEQIQQWQASGYLGVYHYGEDKLLPLHYQFVKDASNYNLSQLTRQLPGLILHGVHDDVVPIEVSRSYAAKHPPVKLIELNSDHGLNDVKEIIWQEIKNFCCLDC
jgi:hypothetical protein